LSGPLRVVLLPGDGVGPEVIAEARRVLEATGLPLELEELPWGSAYWREHGRMMPADALEVVRRFDAVLLGAVGDPGLPDDVTLWGLLLELRQGLDLWANVRPARLLAGIPCPLAGRGPDDVDMLFVRENTEGEYSGVGGRAHRGLPGEVALETSVFTRAGCERVARYAFERARERRGALTSATKSNASRFGYTLWDEVVRAVGAEFPDVRVEHVLVDALCARMVRDPGSIDVVVASNLFGDVLTDLAAALQGGLGMAASANVAPGSDAPGLFEPVHGSAPDLAGRGVANPSGAIWSAALLLEHAAHTEEAAWVLKALETVAREGPKTQDVGGRAGTRDVGEAVAQRVAESAARSHR
jgi:tartrate dehydrogenase/decarboxylase / D-malate dehydrogenase